MWGVYSLLWYTIYTKRKDFNVLWCSQHLLPWQQVFGQLSRSDYAPAEKTAIYIYIYIYTLDLIYLTQVNAFKSSRRTLIILFIINHFFAPSWIISSIANTHYCYMDAPHGRWRSAWWKSLTVIAQECGGLYWTNLEGNIPHNCWCTATYHPSRKLSKLGKQDMQDTIEEVRSTS